MDKANPFSRGSKQVATSGRTSSVCRFARRELSLAPVALRELKGAQIPATHRQKTKTGPTGPRFCFLAVGPVDCGQCSAVAAKGDPVPSLSPARGYRLIRWRWIAVVVLMAASPGFGKLSKRGTPSRSRITPNPIQVRGLATLPTPAGGCSRRFAYIETR
jgi:hypothetical protein